MVMVIVEASAEEDDRQSVCRHFPDLCGKDFRALDLARRRLVRALRSLLFADSPLIEKTHILPAIYACKILLLFLKDVHTVPKDQILGLFHGHQFLIRQIQHPLQRELLIDGIRSIDRASVRSLHTENIFFQVLL